ncbi:synaptic plasticity regulator PANTS [Euwallacea fornicatus]|uniref:synaptic plasticity regulator PANTS n=1 Tax=Euwallacea fornicatus TaxID=995702 RepID=UPI00339066EF
MTDNDTTTTPPKVKDDWMIRDCLVYDEEYRDCTSIKARFNQLFIFGKTLDCSQWKQASLNCYKWVDNKDVKAANDLVESEKQRRKERLLANYRNDVWTKRTLPPENWNAPLPEYLQKEYENSYLDFKSKELRGEIPVTFDPHISSFCTIL